MGTQADSRIEQALVLARDMIQFSNQAQGEDPDDGCAVLYGVIRDCAYRIRAEAERERSAHGAARQPGFSP